MQVVNVHLLGIYVLYTTLYKDELLIYCARYKSSSYSELLQQTFLSNRGFTLRCGIWQRTQMDQGSDTRNVMRFPVSMVPRVIPDDDDTTLNMFIHPALPQNVQDLLDPVADRNYGVVFVIRGVVGIGKSTLAKKIYRWCQGRGLACVICSADVWFLDGAGSYEWYRDGLPAAHNYCKGRFLLAMATRANVVVVDNTNLFPEHYQWYLDHCDAAYHIHVIELDCMDERVAHDAFVRSHHVEPPYKYRKRYYLYQATRDEDAIVVQPTFTRLATFAGAMRIDPPLP